MAELPMSGGTADATELMGTQRVATDPFIRISQPVLLKLGPARYLIDTNVVVPANVTLSFSQGTLVDVSAGMTLEIRGAISAPPAQIFSGAGRISISSTKVDRVFANWFAGAPDLGAQISAATSALPAGGGTVDATSLSGTRTINSSISITKSVILRLGPGVLHLRTSPMFTFAAGGTVSVYGAGRAHTIIDYGLSTGSAISFVNTRSSELHDIAIGATTQGNSATGVVIAGSEHTSIKNVVIDGFHTNLNITTSGSNRSFDTRVIDSQITNCTGNCISIDHAVDTFLTNVIDWTLKGNPTKAWALTIDTGTSGVYIQSMSVLNAGLRIQNSISSATANDFPPEFLFADQLIVDTVTQTDGILFDSSLDRPDAAGRKGKSYHFTNCWSSFTQTDGTVGIVIAGGEDISFTDFRIRLNRYHGVHIRGGRDIRFAHGVIIGNNQQNAADGDGIRVAAGVSGWHVNDVRVGNSVAGESGNQRYGVRIEPGSSTSWSLSFINATGNMNGALLDGSVTANKTKWDVRDDNRNEIRIDDSLYAAKRRLEIGDGNFFLDYRGSEGNSVTFSWDANAYFRYNRSTNTATWLIDGLEKLRLTAGGLSIGTGSRISKIDSLTSTQDFSSIAANSCSDSPPIAFPGAMPGDTLIVTPAAAFVTAPCGSIDACLQVSGYISAADQVKIRTCNASGQNAVKLPKTIFRIELIRH